MLDPLRLVDVANHTDRTRTKGLYIPRKVYGYSVYTSTVFNGVYTKKRQGILARPIVTSANLHQTKYEVNNPKVSSLSLSGYLQSVGVGGGRRDRGIVNDNRGVGVK